MDKMDRITVRVTTEEREAISSVASRLSLSESEVSRRCVRIGLKTLSRTDLPGSEPFRGKGDTR
jgi:hypothetical protein